MLFSDLAYAAFLKYSPRGQTELSRSSKQITLAVKSDGVVATKAGQQRAIPYSVTRLGQETPKHESLRSLFDGQASLVPVPRRAPMVAGWLWPTLRICQEIASQGLAAGVLPLLARTIAVTKSATAAPGQRPDAKMHYDSLAVESNRPMLTRHDRVIIVDDVVTRGATFLACHARLREAYPDVNLSCFALIRTVSSGELDVIVDPVAGAITMSSGYPHRQP